MSNPILLGDGVRCDLDVLVNTRLLIQANSGGGKSWCLRRLLEQTHGRIQHLVIDPEGEFSSLRAKFDYVLAAKRDGDTLADPRSAKLLAERLLELGVSAILDIYELKPDERKRFVKVFIDSLVDAPKHLWHPALVVLDEAHVYCPESGDAESADAVKSLATRGRKRGFCAVFATQRLAKFAKDAAAECNNKLIGRTSIDVDMKRAGEELGFTSKDDKLALRDLGAGEFFVFGPAFTRSVTKFIVGSVQTEHPKAGAHLAAVVPQPSERVKSVLAKLSDLPQEAERKAATEAELRGHIQQLSRDLKAAQRAQPTPAPVVRDVPVFTDAERATLAALKGRVDDVSHDVSGIAVELATLTRTVSTRLQVAPRPTPAIKVNNFAPPVRVQPRARVASSGVSMASGERKILTVLANYPQGRTKNQLGVITGYAVNGGGFNNYLSTLRTKGWIVGSDPINLTDEGAEALGPIDALPQGEELIAHWQRQLGKAERAIFDVLVSQYPQTLTKESIAADAGYEVNGGGFNNALSRLRTLELVTRGSDIRASEHLFQ